MGGSIAESVLEHQCGAINIEECKIGTDLIRVSGKSKTINQDFRFGQQLRRADYVGATHVGRWPANVILSTSTTMPDFFIKFDTEE